MIPRYRLSGVYTYNCSIRLYTGKMGMVPTLNLVVTGGVDIDNHGMHMN